MVNVKDLLFVTRTSAVASRIRDLENSPIVYAIIHNYTVEDTLKEIEKLRKFWNKKISKYVEIFNGKRMPSENDYINWKNSWQIESKIISASYWAEKYAIPYAGKMVIGLDSAEKGIKFLLKRYIKGHDG